ncbi:Vesicular integral-membrane protein VIP36 [Entomortierella beljakovae]|nr:Vesicular integral-membrane protein VIP36 [Entomortierella beljakovae]
MYGIMNDGTKNFPSNPTQNSNSFGGCLRDYKNTANPVFVHVSYIGRTLKVSTDIHTKGKKLLPCFEQKDLDLPVGYYFGLSASASDIGTPDDHDIYSLEVYEAHPPAKEKVVIVMCLEIPREEEMKKRGEEIVIDESDRKTYEDVQHIVEDTEAKMKETEIPEILTSAQIAASVADTQSRIIDSLNSLHNKLESIGAPVQAPETTAHSINDINANINKITASIQAMEAVVEGLVNHIVKQGGVSDGSDITKILKEELQNLNYKMEDMDSRQALNHRVTQSRLASSSSWVSYVVYLILFQIVAFSAYTWYKKRQEYNEKKFL